MTTKAQKQNNKNQIEELHAQAVTKHKQNQLKDALALYLQSIELDQFQSEWVYANAITIAAQINNYDLAHNLIQKANKIYFDSAEISRASGILYHKLNNIDKAIESYQKTITLEPEQPEWVYVKLIELLIQSELYDHAQEIKKAAIKQFPQSQVIQQNSHLSIPKKNNTFVRQEASTSTDIKQQQMLIEREEVVLTRSRSREVPPSIEDYLDLNIDRIRRKLTDTAIVERYLILLNQMLCNINQGKKEMDVDALIHCLAEIKTDIHYLKTKVINPPLEAVDPQAKPNVKLDKIIGLSQPILIKCDFKERIVGSGWYDAEEHGRWSGPGTVSSVVLPCPVAGRYRFEMIVRAEAKPELLQTLIININDHPLATSLVQSGRDFFPAVVTGELIIPQGEDQSFLAIDLIVNETIIPLETDSRLIGLLIEKISLIPTDTTTN